jgi:hypothetical protein
VGQVLSSKYVSRKYVSSKMVCRLQNADGGQCLASNLKLIALMCSNKVSSWRTADRRWQLADAAEYQEAGW